jgi:transcriptional regulator with GAF, ATPase, and Fis domain
MHKACQVLQRVALAVAQERHLGAVIGAVMRLIVQGIAGAEPAVALANARSFEELERLRAQLERESLAAALRQTHGKIAGPRGAAALLGMKPTTLTSRLKALGLRWEDLQQGLPSR